MNKHDEWWNTNATLVDLTDKNLSLQMCLDQIIPAIDPVIDNAASEILDYGCGIGRLAIPIARHYMNSNVIGYDINQSFLDIATKKSSEERLATRCFFAPFITHGFKVNAAYSMLVFQHLPIRRKREALELISESMKIGGIFRLQYVEGDADTFLTHDASFTDMSSWIKDAGFQIQSVDYDIIEPRWTWVTAVKERG